MVERIEDLERCPPGVRRTAKEIASDFDARLVYCKDYGGYVINLLTWDASLSLRITENIYETVIRGELEIPQHKVNEVIEEFNRIKGKIKGKVDILDPKLVHQSKCSVIDVRNSYEKEKVIVGFVCTPATPDPREYLGILEEIRRIWDKYSIRSVELTHQT